MGAVRAPRAVKEPVHRALKSKHQRPLHLPRALPQPHRDDERHGPKTARRSTGSSTVDCNCGASDTSESPPHDWRAGGGSCRSILGLGAKRRSGERCLSPIVQAPRLGGNPRVRNILRADTLLLCPRIWPYIYTAVATVKLSPHIGFQSQRSSTKGTTSNQPTTNARHRD